MSENDLATQGRGGGQGTAGEVFLAFLKLGVTAFGGPIAHLGYFRDELVVRRRWLDEKAYADLIALCQFLPGPASSQVGFALGLLRAGPLGALAAFAAFTLPSAVLLVLFAYGAAGADNLLVSGAVEGLKIVAVAIIAQAVWGMARTLCPDRKRAAIALVAIVSTALFVGAVGQLGAIVLGALAGLALCRDASAPSEPGAYGFRVPQALGLAALALFFGLLVGVPVLVAQGAGHGLAVFDAFYRAGALVFGGGHVVLPLLQAETVQPGWVTPDAFLSGYGAAQAIPGPLFTFAAYLGTVLVLAPNGVLGAVIALGAIFLPGFLVLLGVMPFWDRLRRYTLARAAMAGTNAAVVGILAAALYDPVFTGAVSDRLDFALAAIAFILLAVFKAPPWAVVIVAALGGILIALV